MSPNEKRRVRDQERRATKKAAEESWRAHVDAHFGFLREQYGFQISRICYWFWSTDAVYQTDLVEVGVTRSVEFNGADMWLHRRPDWILPGEPVYTTMNLTHEQVFSRLLLRLRAPHLLPELDGLQGLDDEIVEKRLALMARILREYGGDLLHGNFAQLGAQSATMYDDVPPREPVITLWVPEESNKAQRDSWAEATRQRSPGIRVIVRTYRPETIAKRSARKKKSNLSS
jgi:hypothetical protein